MTSLAFSPHVAGFDPQRALGPDRASLGELSDLLIDDFRFTL